MSAKPARTLIVDDEVLARRRLSRLLADRPDVELIGECRNGREAVQAIRSQPTDLLFLDVQMPNLDGVGVLEEVGLSAVGAVVFVTAFDQYALQAFDLHAVDYLLKPFTDDRFHRALDRALGRLRRRAAESLSETLVAAVEHYRAQRPAEPPETPPLPAEPPSYRLMVKSLGKIRFVPTSEIDWLEAAGSYVRLHTAERSCLIRETMTRLEERLPQESFLRIHRSTMVNIERVVEILPFSHRELILVLRDGTRLKLSRSYRDRAEAVLGLSSP